MPVRIEPFREDIFVGDRAYLDANFIISVFDFSLGRPLEPKLLFAEFLKQKTTLLVSPLTMDEVWWTVLQELNRRDGYRNVRQRIRERPDDHLTPYLSQLREALNAMQRWPHIEWVDAGAQSPEIESCIADAFENMDTYSLSPRDAFHLRHATGNDANALVTSDPDFDHLAGNQELDLLIIKVP